MTEERCNLCGKRMILQEDRVVNETKYKMYKCEDCKRIVAKTTE